MNNNQLHFVNMNEDKNQIEIYIFTMFFHPWTLFIYQWIPMAPTSVSVYMGAQHLHFFRQGFCALCIFLIHLSESYRILSLLIYFSSQISDGDLTPIVSPNWGPELRSRYEVGAPDVSRQLPHFAINLMHINHYLVKFLVVEW